MEPVAWFALPVNPEPWGVGPLGVSRTGGGLHPYMGRNQQLYAYQEAIKDELIRLYPGYIELKPPYYELDFYFWRNQAVYEGANKTVQKNIADATNMQKATEDALQGLLIENDRLVTRVSASIMAQGPDVRGAVAFRLRWGRPAVQEETEPPDYILADVLRFATELPVNPNVWPPRF